MTAGGSSDGYLQLGIEALVESAGRELGGAVVWATVRSKDPSHASYRHDVAATGRNHLGKERLRDL